MRLFLRPLVGTAVMLSLGLKWEAVRNKESGDKRYAADRCQVTRHAARSETADGCRSDGDASAPSFPAPAKSA